MTSNDYQQYITVDVFKSEIDEIQTEIHNIGTQLKELKTEIKVVNDNLLVNSTKIDDMYFFMGVGFAIIAIVVTFVGFVITLAPTILEFFKNKKQEKNFTTTEQVQNIVEQEKIAAKVFNFTRKNKS